MWGIEVPSRMAVHPSMSAEQLTHKHSTNILPQSTLAELHKTRQSSHERPHLSAYSSTTQKLLEKTLLRVSAAAAPNCYHANPTLRKKEISPRGG